MKTLFVNVCLRPEAPHRFLPVGLGYIVTFVKESGIDFDLLDIDIGRYSDQYVEQYLIKNNYDVIAVGSIVTHYKWIKWFIHTAVKHNPGCKIVVGNSVGSSIAEVLFAVTPVDIIIQGEGEVTTVEVLRAISDGKSLGVAKDPLIEIPHNYGREFPCSYEGIGIEGIFFRDSNNRIINNGRRKAARKIDEFPFPDWDIFDIDSYLKSHSAINWDTYRFKAEDGIVMPVNTARGCVFKCTFCHYMYWYDPYRHRSPGNIIQEIKRNQRKWGANIIEFWDDLSFHKLGPTEKFLDALIKADLNIHFSCAIRSDLMGKDIDDKGNEIPYEKRLRVGEKFVEAGCLSVGYSLESGNDEILKAMNKRVKSRYFEEQVKICREVGIVTRTSLVIGYPQETPETIAESMKMCEKLGVYPSTGFLLPLPETGMWDYAFENGHITDTDKYLTEMTERQDIVMNMTKMSDKQVMKEVTTWLGKLNDKFGNLDKKNLIKTGGYNKHSKHQVKKLKVNNKMIKIVEKNESTNESLNYATVSGDM